MEVCVFADEVSSDFDEALRLSRQAGATSVEIRGGLYGHDVTSVTVDDIERIKAALGQHGMRVASIGSPFGKCHVDRPEEVARHQEFFPRLLDLGQALECRLIRCFAFWNPRSNGSRARLADYLELVVDGLRPAVNQANERGFVFGLELAAETFVATGDEVRLLRSALDENPALRVVWDLAAEASAGELPYPDGYRLMKDWIVHVHIKPNQEGNMDTVPGTSVTNLEALERLRHDGYTAAVSIEHWGSSAKMIEGVRQLRSALATL